MINVSNEFKRCLAEDRRDFLVWINVVNSNGMVLNLDNSDIWENSFNISDGVSASGQFTIGSCIINKLSFTINNIYDEFSDYNFDGASVTVYMGLKIKNKTERIRKGTFIVDETSYDGSTITLECLDYMSKFDVDYKDVTTIYPASLERIVRDICNYCGVSLQTSVFDNVFEDENQKYEALFRPDDEALTCRQVLAYCAQIACKWARCDAYGFLELKWYDQEKLEKDVNLDGGFFDDGTLQYYSSGYHVEGGNFHDYDSGDALDGNTFDELDTFHHLYSMSSFSASTDDVVITGIQVTEDFAETERDKCNTVLEGTEGYLLAISDNKLIQKRQARIVAKSLKDKLVGMRFRPLSAQVQCDPTVEAGDLAYVTDRKQNTYNCFVTNLTFNLGGHMSVSCDAEAPGKNSAKQYSELTQAIIQARKNAQAQIDEYNLAVQQLTNLITNSFGVFKTEEILDDSSTIYYMHDKPTLEESRTIWKMTADAFAVSTDGGKTYNGGMDSSGNVVVNVLSAIGINCDWIHAGTLTLGGYNNQNGRLVMQDANGNEIGRWDNGGVYSTGHYISDDPKDKTKIDIYNGSIKISDYFGHDVDIVFSSTKENPGIAIIDRNENYNILFSCCKVLSELNADRVSIRAEELMISNKRRADTGKTGTAEFSDGTYLEFINGILVGGHSQGGSF